MLDSAISAARWIADTLLKKHSEDKTIKRQKWIQVADYLETIADQIETCISQFDKNIIPYVAYGQLTDMRNDFGDVLAQIYDEDEDEDRDRIGRYCDALDRALPRIFQHDEIRHRLIIFDEGEREMFSDLQMIAGQFRGLASTLKAMA